MFSRPAKIEAETAAGDAMSAPLLPAFRIFIADDDAAVAQLLADLIADIGHQAAAVETSHAAALAAAETVEADLAILDINLRGRPSFAIADRLIQRGIPVIFATGYGILELSGKYENAELLKKPFRQADLAEAILRLMRAEMSAGITRRVSRGSTPRETAHSN